MRRESKGEKTMRVVLTVTFLLIAAPFFLSIFVAVPLSIISSLEHFLCGIAAGIKPDDRLFFFALYGGGLVLPGICFLFHARGNKLSFFAEFFWCLNALLNAFLLTHLVAEHRPGADLSVLVITPLAGLGAASGFLTAFMIYRAQNFVRRVLIGTFFSVAWVYLLELVFPAVVYRGLP